MYNDLKSLLEPIIRPIIIDAVLDALEGIKLSPPTQPTNGKLYLSAKEAADFMGIKLQTLYQNIERIPHVKRHGKLLFTRDGLIKYIEEGGQKR